MIKKKNIIESLVGTVVLILGIGFAYKIYKQGASNASRVISLKAEFDSVTGLTKGAPVKMNGVLVGDVASITLDQKKNYNAVVTFHIDEAYPVPSDSQASIVSENFMGNKVLNISPGIKDTFFKQDEIIYDTISSSNFEDLLQKFMIPSGTKDPEEEMTEPLENETPDVSLGKDSKKS